MYWFTHKEPYVPHETMVERVVMSTFSSSNMHWAIYNNNNPYRNMVMDAMIMNRSYTGQCPIVDEELNVDVARFYYLLKDSNELLWDECTNHSKLLVIA
jgi:hypothetical protein